MNIATIVDNHSLESIRMLLSSFKMSNIDDIVVYLVYSCIDTDVMLDVRFFAKKLGYISNIVECSHSDIDVFRLFDEEPFNNLDRFIFMSKDMIVNDRIENIYSSRQDSRYRIYTTNSIDHYAIMVNNNANDAYIEECKDSSIIVCPIDNPLLRNAMDYNALNYWKSVVSYKRRLLAIDNKITFMIEPAVSNNCNLNCAYCDHCSPVAKRGFYSVNQYHKDINVLSKLIDDQQVKRHFDFGIQFVGGEPLLNEDLFSLVEETENAFDTSTLTNYVIITNGSLIPKNADKIVDCLNRFPNLGLYITKYSLSNIDYDYVFKSIEDRLPSNAKINNYEEKTSFTKMNLNLNVNRWSKEDGYFNCISKNHCLTMSNGKLYPCSTAGNYVHLKDFFDLEDVEDCSLNLDEYTTVDDFIDFLIGPWEFCKYCRKRDEDCLWHYSNRSKEEWFEV